MRLSSRICIRAGAGILFLLNLPLHLLSFVMLLLIAISLSIMLLLFFAILILCYSYSFYDRLSQLSPDPVIHDPVSIPLFVSINKASALHSQRKNRKPRLQCIDSHYGFSIIDTSRVRFEGRQSFCRLLLFAADISAGLQYYTHEFVQETCGVNRSVSTPGGRRHKRIATALRKKGSRKALLFRPAVRLVE